jgi:hypothetical protein
MDRRVTAWVGGGAVVLALLVVGDRAAQVAVERIVAGRLQDCLRTPDRPSVGIPGFPIVHDLARRQLDTVTMSARDVDAGGVKVDELGAELHGVRQSGDTAEIDSLAGSGLVTYDDLSAVAPGVRVSYGGAGLLRMDMGVGLFGASATARPELVGDSVVVEPERFSSAFTGDLDVGGFPAVTYKLRDVPAGVNLTMDPTERGIEFAFDGRDVEFPTSGGCPLA